MDISRGQSGNRRGVETATQEDAERDIGHKATAGCAGENFEQFRSECGFTFLRLLRLQRVAPVAGNARRASIHRKRELVGGREFVNAFDSRVRCRDERMGEKLDPGNFRLVAWRKRMLEERGQLRGEGKGAVSMKVIEGLFPKAVTGQKEAPCAGIVNGKRPHAIESGKHPLPPFAPCVEQDFGIRVIGGENVSLGEEFAAEFAVIVDFAVENNGEATISGNHRLRATSEIDDREAAVAQKNTGIRFFKITLRIRPTVRETASHALQIRAVARAEKSGYAAHQTEPVCPSQFRVLLTR